MLEDSEREEMMICDGDAAAPIEEGFTDRNGVHHSTSCTRAIDAKKYPRSPFLHTNTCSCGAVDDTVEKLRRDLATAKATILALNMDRQAFPATKPQTKGLMTIGSNPFRDLTSEEIAALKSIGGAGDKKGETGSFVPDYNGQPRGKIPDHIDASASWPSAGSAGYAITPVVKSENAPTPSSEPAPEVVDAAPVAEAPTSEKPIQLAYGDLWRLRTIASADATGAFKALIGKQIERYLCGSSMAILNAATPIEVPRPWATEVLDSLKEFPDNVNFVSHYKAFLKELCEDSP